VESDLNDPMSAFLIVALVELIAVPDGLIAGHAALQFLEETDYRAIFGIISGYALLWLFRHLLT